MAKLSRNSMMGRSLSKGKVVWEFFLDLFFPKFCVGCNLEGEWVCQVCEEKVVRVVTQICPDCERISENGLYCKTCRRKHKLSGIIVAAYYKEGPIKEAIHNLKYNNVLELRDFLGKLMTGALKDNLDVIEGEVILTAVPMHYLKKAQRGYNQAEILAEEVGERLGKHPQNIPAVASPSGESLPTCSTKKSPDGDTLLFGLRKLVLRIFPSPKRGEINSWNLNNVNFEKNFKIIKKIRKTKSQVSYSGKKRRGNLKNSFKIIDKIAVKNRTIIIIDDVTTTGTTLEECARVFKTTGAKKVWGLVVAKG